MKLADNNIIILHMPGVDFSYSRTMQDACILWKMVAPKNDMSSDIHEVLILLNRYVLNKH